MENQIREKIREEEAKRILNELQEKYEIDTVDEMVKNNEIEFKHNDKKYKTIMLTMSDKDELDLLRRKKFGQLIQDKDILLEKDLVRIYKERGVDIDDINKQIKGIETERFNFQMKLGEALTNKLGDSIIKEYNKNIEELTIKIRLLEITKNDLLQYSLENQLMNYVAEVITYLSLYVSENNEWKRVFNSFEDFKSSKDEELKIKSAKKSICLQYF